MQFRSRGRGRDRKVYPLKNISNKQYRGMLKKLAPFADADKDGVPNIRDCFPFNKHKQDAQVFLEPSEEDMIKIGVKEKKAQGVLDAFLKETARGHVNTINKERYSGNMPISAYTLSGVPDKTFLGWGLGKMDFDKPKNIKNLSKSLSHEELHNLLEKEFGKEASLKLDLISVPVMPDVVDVKTKYGKTPMMTRIWNPETMTELSPKLAKIAFEMPPFRASHIMFDRNAKYD